MGLSTKLTHIQYHNTEIKAQRPFAIYHLVSFSSSMSLHTFFWKAMFIISFIFIMNFEIFEPLSLQVAYIK